MGFLKLKDMKASNFQEIDTSYTDDNGVTFLDGYKTNVDEGQVVGYFINGGIYYTDPDFQFDPLVGETVESLRNEFIKTV